MNRRSFIASLAALAVVPKALLALRPAINPDRLPVLWADGVQDDAPALQAWCDGYPIWDARNRKEVGFRITGRSLRIKETIYVGWPERQQGPRYSAPKSITDCSMITSVFDDHYHLEW